MIIIIDSNIWLTELALNSALGSAIRFYIKKSNAKIALPEVVRLEVEHNFRNRLKGFVDEIDKNHRQLLAIFGKLKQVVLPDDSDINGRISEIFSNLGVELIDIPFTMESAHSSFLKTIKKDPPSDKTQEFKDGVLWSDCCKMLEDYDVSLVTADKAFFDSRDYSKGLAQNLLNEISKKPYHLKIFSSLKELLVELKTEIEIEEKILIDTIINEQKQSIEGLLNRAGHQMSDNSRVDFSAYITENPNLLFLEFMIKIDTYDINGESENGVLTIRGDANLKTEEREYFSIRVWVEELLYQKNNEENRKSNKIIYASGNVGHNVISHSVRYKM